MPDPTSEAALVNRIVKAVRRTYPNAFVFKVVGHPFQISGIPDLLLCIDGLFIGCEVKWQRPGESHAGALSRVTRQQQHQIKQIVSSGGMAGAVTSVDEALDLIDRAFKKADRPNPREKD